MSQNNELDSGARVFFTVTIVLMAAVIVIVGTVLFWAWPAHAETGLASWYSGGGTFCHDARVRPLTAAHRSLPCGAWVRVTTADNGEPRSVEVQIRDRGPFVRGRIIDVDPVAARQLGLLGAGVRRVTVERIR